jgi:hypothetical protein
MGYPLSGTKVGFRSSSYQVASSFHFSLIICSRACLDFLAAMESDVCQQAKEL